MDTHLTIDEAATLSRLSARTVRRGLKSADRPLRHYRIGRRVVIPRDDLDAWLEMHRVGPETAAPRDRGVADILRRLNVGGAAR